MINFFKDNFPETRLESENAINLTAMEKTLTLFDGGSWREIQVRGQSSRKNQFTVVVAVASKYGFEHLPTGFYVSRSSEAQVGEYVYECKILKANLFFPIGLREQNWVEDNVCWLMHSLFIK